MRFPRFSVVGTRVRGNKLTHRQRRKSIPTQPPIGLQRRRKETKFGRLTDIICCVFVATGSVDSVPVRTWQAQLMAYTHERTHASTDVRGIVIKQIRRYNPFLHVVIH